MEALSLHSCVRRSLLRPRWNPKERFSKCHVAPVRTTILSALSYDTKETAMDSLALEVRKEFPALQQMVNGRPLVYLDSAATSQKPQEVLDAMDRFWQCDNANVHRGVHTLSARATDAYEAARVKVASFINSPGDRQVVFTRNASEAINLVAYSWGMQNLKPGDEIVLSVAEHHSNIVPWQMIAKKTGAVLQFAQLTTDQQIDIEHMCSLIGNKTKLVSVQHTSNTLGSSVDVAAVVDRAHQWGALVLLDACQSVPHMAVDVQALDVDFMAVSAHKMCGPTGIGFLFGKKEILESMPPFMGGGEMIQDVFFHESTYAEPPSRFEAGTPAIAEAIGLGAACDYLTKIGMERIHRYEMEMGNYLYRNLEKLPGVTIYGPPPSPEGKGRAALCSFNVEGIHGTDLAIFLDQQHGVAVRSGHHCTQPLHRLLGINSSARASLYFYNTKEDIDTFLTGLADTIDFFTNPPKF